MFHKTVRGRRRSVAAVLGLALAGVLCAAGPAAATPAGAGGASSRDCRAVTTFGRVRGLTEGATCAYRGVYYAAPPTGARRFLPPAPPAHWHGTLAATAAKPGCPRDLDAGGGGDAGVVSVGYRLGMLGWTELGGLDQRYAGSGNNGLRDEIAALTWVRQRICGFGATDAAAHLVVASAAHDVVPGHDGRLVRLRPAERASWDAYSFPSWTLESWPVA